MTRKNWGRTFQLSCSENEFLGEKLQVQTLVAPSYGGDP